MRTDWAARGLGLILWLSVGGVCPAFEARDLSHSAGVEDSRWHQTRLGKAESLLQAGWVLDAIGVLQNLLDAPPGFVSRDTGYENSHQAAAKMLETLPATWLAGYENQFGSLAREKLAEAKKQSDWAAVRKIASQYRMTQAGFEALEALGGAGI